MGKMIEYLEVLEKSGLFGRIEGKDILCMFDCLGVKNRSFLKEEYVFRYGEKIHSIALLLSGKVCIESTDFWGERHILGVITPGEIFAEAYAFDQEMILNDVIAEEMSLVLFLNAEKVLRTCSSSCPFHTSLIDNLFCMIARKNRNLVQKINQVTKRSTREKVLSYLSDQAKKCGDNQFSIPFDRQALADYLAVDRSALSSVLSRLREEKIIEFHKNEFKLL